MKKLSDNLIISLYTQEHLTIRQIAKLAEVSHTYIWKILQNYGVKAIDGERVNTSCAFCGKTITRLRCKTRNNYKSYCNQDCYIASLENPGYKPWREGQRLARAIVGQYFKLSPENIVHHEDGDNRNNDRNNLKAFRNQSEHLKYHRLGKNVNPIWDGSLL